MLSSELSVLVMLVTWLAVVTIATALMVARINRRAPQTQFQANRSLVYGLPIVALILWLLYCLAKALVAGRIKLPVRGDDFYFYLSHSPIGFWLVFSFIFLLTAGISTIMAAPIYLILRRSRHGA